MSDEAVIGEDAAQVVMAFENNTEEVECLALEPSRSRPHTSERGHDWEVVVRTEHPDPQTMVALDRQEMHHHGITRTVVTALAVVAVIHSAEIDQGVELQAGGIAQMLADIQVVSSPDNHGGLAQGFRNGDRLVGHDTGFQTCLDQAHVRFSQ